MDAPDDERPRLIVGLGNPGSDYAGTRHNLGFRVVDRLAELEAIRVDRLECNALVGRRGALMLAKPQTYMNRSGYSVRCLLERDGYDTGDLLVVYDEVALPLGRLRLRPRGSPGGHRGMESVVQNLRTDRVARLRLGIGWEDEPPPAVDLVEYVLARFDDDELETVEEMVGRAAEACRSWLDQGAEATMARFN